MCADTGQNLKGRDSLEDVGVDLRIILKLIEINRVSGCEHSGEPSGSTKVAQLFRFQSLSYRAVT